MFSWWMNSVSTVLARCMSWATPTRPIISLSGTSSRAISSSRMVPLPTMPRMGPTWPQVRLPPGTP